MAITNFVPEIWAAALLKALRDQLVFGQKGIINRNYEGEIARAGDTVHITSFGDPAVRAYSKNGNITWDLLTDSSIPLVVDQSNYFAFKVDDIDKRQALPGFIEESSVGAAYNLAAVADTFLGKTMFDGSAGTPLSVDVDTPESAYDLLVKLRTQHVRANTPNEGRWVVVPPELYAKLLKDDRFIRADASGTTTGLRNGQVGRAAGFDIIEANTIQTVGGSGADKDAFKITSGHSIATTYAEQINSTEAIRLENTFADGIRGLHLFGAKVIRPKNLVSAKVNVAA